MSPAEPERLLAGRYRLRAIIGRGGMGLVWRARDELLGRDVAVKEIVLPPHLDAAEQEVARQRALREAQMAARLSHPNVVGIYDVVEEDEQPWIVMELVPYRSLRDLVMADGPMPPARAAQVGLGILAALRAAHDRGVLHRDVKPANVLLAPEGRVVLTDFGIARAADSPVLTGTGVLVGSPSYIAPERARGDRAAAAADLWALGACLYAAVEGHPPFDREGALASLTAVVTDEPDPPSHAGPLWPVISGLLRKDPEKRLSADEAEQLLQQVAAAEAEPWAEPEADPEPPAEAEGETAKAATGPIPAAADTERRTPARAALAAAPGGPDVPGVSGSETADPPGRPEVAPAEVAVPATGAVPADSPSHAAPGRRRGRVLGAAAAAAAVIAAVVVSVVLTSSNSSGQHRAAAPPASSRSTPASKRPTPASSPSASPAASPSAKPSAPSSASGGTSVLPAGYYRFTNSTGFSIGVPTGWQIQHVGHYVYVRDPGDSGIFLLIDQSDQPQPNALEDWKQQAAARQSSYPGYHLLRLQDVSYPQAEQAADWEFTYDRNGIPVHILNRNVLANSAHAYALYWSTPSSDWTADYHYFQAFAETFRPAGVDQG
ncbi:MAG TPA: serine/threonine-protein kinase [Streptosporangiaceae bacterium]|jgi:serine/threonine protein kinase|nr:serine/threonine-protein kinase [Streptosporangiaceae bacterium]